MGNGYQSDIALDDIRVESGVCPPIGNCDFEVDMCGYFNYNSNKKGQFDWLRNSGSTLTSRTGPPGDHTTLSSEGTIH